MNRLTKLIEAGDSARLARVLASESHAAIDLASSLFAAVTLGDLASVELLVAHGAAVNVKHESDGWTPLHTAVEHGHLDVVRWLVEHGADVNGAAAEGMTPLHLAVDVECDGAHQTGTERSLDSVRALLALHADATRRDVRGQTAADWAEEYGDDELAKLLRAAAPNE